MDYRSLAIGKMLGGGGGGTDVSDTTAVAGDVKTGKYFYTSSGVKTEGSLVPLDVSDTTAAAGDVKSGKYFYTSSGVKTEGSLVPLDVSDTTAVASDVASGKYFYLANGTKTVGTASGGGGTPGKYWFNGLECEKVETVADDKVYLKDTDYNTWTPSTTELVLHTYSQVKCDGFNIESEWIPFIVTKFLFAPVYTGTPSGARIIKYSELRIISPKFTKSTIANLDNGTWTGNSADNVIKSIGVYKGTGDQDTFIASPPTCGVYISGNATMSNSGNNYYVALTPKISTKCNTYQFSTDNAALIDKTNSYYHVVIEKWKAKDTAVTAREKVAYQWYSTETI